MFLPTKLNMMNIFLHNIYMEFTYRQYNGGLLTALSSSYCFSPGPALAGPGQ